MSNERTVEMFRTQRDTLGDFVFKNAETITMKTIIDIINKEYKNNKILHDAYFDWVYGIEAMKLDIMNGYIIACEVKHIIPKTGY